MKLYIDTEFNGFGGDLISLALATEAANGKHFYGILELPACPFRRIRPPERQRR